MALEGRQIMAMSKHRQFSGEKEICRMREDAITALPYSVRYPTAMGGKCGSCVRDHGISNLANTIHLPLTRHFFAV
jgi:hypothetical protein